MYYNNETAEFYCEKEFVYKIPLKISKQNDQTQLSPDTDNTPLPSDSSQQSGRLVPLTSSMQMQVPHVRMQSLPFSSQSIIPQVATNLYPEPPPPPPGIIDITPGVEQPICNPFLPPPPGTIDFTPVVEQRNPYNFIQTTPGQSQQQTSQSVINSDSAENASNSYVNTATKSALKRKSDSLSPSVTEPDLPLELKKLMQALCCELCNVKLNSPITAKIHYDSKVHEKKVRLWLEEWTKTTGNPIPERLIVNKNVSTGANTFHCATCDIPLSSQIHADQHYLGRRHQSVLRGLSKPKGSGYYDNDGVWHRTIIKVSTDGRFDIGNSFEKPTEADKQLQTVPTDVTPNKEISHTPDVSLNFYVDTLQPSPPKKSKESMLHAQFHCDLCDISTTNQQLLDLHFNGAKHAKKLKQQTALGIVDETNVVSSKFSANRTPSGLFYCPACDITVTSENCLKNHFQSKKHINKAKLKKGNKIK